MLCSFLFSHRQRISEALNEIGLRGQWRDSAANSKIVASCSDPRGHPLKFSVKLWQRDDGVIAEFRLSNVSNNYLFSCVLDLDLRVFSLECLCPDPSGGRAGVCAALQRHLPHADLSSLCNTEPVSPL